MSSIPTLPVIVLTDLDGTLLDHHDYSTSAARAALNFLQQHHVPLIFNTSKTQPEVIQLRRQMANTSPYVCENGGAIYYFDNEDQWHCELPGAGYSDILKVLNQLRKDGFNFRGFNDMTDTEVAAITGLSVDDAHHARQRAATEPLLWRGDEDSISAFRDTLTAHGLRLLKGGRFYHVMGDADKASAVTFFKDFYRQHWGLNEAPLVISLGDEENDRAMLEASDYPVVIPGESGTLELTNPRAHTAEFKGPKGWNHTLLPLLEKLFKENCGG
ncbi:hypothetical protein A3746_07075 [Oleibacter sp. HI0075]|nr:hypothetical protein A3746_07075 [Oleibacter sp. HI0075]